MPRLRHDRALAAMMLTLALVGGCDDGRESGAAKAPSAAREPASPGGSKAGAPSVDPDGVEKDDAKAGAEEKVDPEPAPNMGPDAGGGAAPLAASPQGPAYFAVRDRGVVRLQDGAFTRVDGAPDILLRDMHVAEDGKLYLLASKGIMRIEGDKATMVAETTFKTTGSVDAFAVTNDGTVWAVGYKGVSKWDGKAWTSQEKTVLGPDITLLKGIAVDGHGRVWLATSNRLHTLDGETWSEVDVSKLFSRKPFFDKLRRAPDGTVYAQASTALVRAESPAELEAVDLGIDGFSSLGNLAFADNGVMAIRSKVDAVMVRMPDGSSREYSSRKDFDADTIRALGVDATGRVWLGTDIGVAVLGPGEAKTQWNSGSVLELAGQVEQIVPIGAGPDLPAVGPVKTGSLRGRILTEGKGLASAAVELCPSPDMMFETSPCGEAVVRFSGTTNADGEFTFENVPIGAYGIAVEVAGKWQLTMSSNFGTKMKEGDTYDIGTINVKPK